jgi:hypothetical protein
MTIQSVGSGHAQSGGMAGSGFDKVMDQARTGGGYGSPPTNCPPSKGGSGKGGSKGASGSKGKGSSGSKGKGSSGSKGKGSSGSKGKGGSGKGKATQAGGGHGY